MNEDTSGPQHGLAERKIEIIVEEMPRGIVPRYHVSTETAEDFVRQAFELVVKEAGYRLGWELWKKASYRSKGRPKTPKYKDALLLPAIRRKAREMPEASATAIVTAVVGELEQYGHRWGASTQATVKRLVKKFDGFFVRHGRKKKGRD